MPQWMLRRALAILPLTIAVIASVLPLFWHGFAVGDDWSFELVRLAEYRVAWLGGQHPPFWAPDLYGGYGSPIFLFYAPLYMAVSSLLVAITHDVIRAASAALVLFSVLGALLMWRFVRQICPASPAAARIATMVYVLYPYLLADKWIRNADAEFTALSIFPGILIGATARNAKAAFWWTTLSLSGLILAHNITALTGVAMAVGIALFVHRSFRRLVPVVLGIASALALTAFFWVPAFTLQPLIHTHDLLIGKFDFHYQFPELLALIWPSQFYSPGVLMVVLLIVGILLPSSDSYARRVQHALLIASAVLIFMMIPLSTKVWEAIPLLPYVQFPWRFFGPLGIGVAGIAGIAWTRLSRVENTWWVEAVVLALLLINAYPAFKAYQPMPAKVREDGKEALTPGGIDRRKLSTTVYDEYLPVGGLLLHAPPTEQNRVLFQKWFFPVWTATVDGHRTPLERGPNGIVAVPVAPGHGDVSLILTEPEIRKEYKVISLAAAVALIGVLAWMVYERVRRI